MIWLNTILWILFQQNNIQVVQSLPESSQTQHKQPGDKLIIGFISFPLSDISDQFLEDAHNIASPFPCNFMGIIYQSGGMNFQCFH